MTNFKNSILGALILCLLVVSPASAATTAGDSSSTTNAACGLGSLFVSAGAGFQTPQGVVTSWSTRRGDGAATMALKIIRDAGTNQVVVGSTAVTTVTNALSTHASRISVEAGDWLGIWTGSTQQCWFQPQLGQATRSYTSATDPAVGSSFSISPASPSYVLSLAAVVEPDIDRDGFGDETQDGCPANPTRQAPPCVETPVTVPAKTCTVPSLKAKTKSAAKTAIEAAGCKLGQTKKKKLRKFTKKQKRNRVRSQSPAAGQVVPAATAVTITVNVKKPTKK